MKKLLSGMYAAALAATFAITSIVPAAAAPIFVPQTISAQSDVTQVNHRRQNFRNNGNYAFYNGHRGYRQHRRGYRQHNGFWFPAGAFIAGALITGAIINNDNYSYRRYGGGSHVSWCYNRYRSYREYDNTFQPYHGRRQQCYSPY